MTKRTIFLLDAIALTVLTTTALAILANLEGMFDLPLDSEAVYSASAYHAGAGAAPRNFLYWLWYSLIALWAVSPLEAVYLNHRLLALLITLLLYSACRVSGSKPAFAFLTSWTFIGSLACVYRPLIGQFALALILAALIFGRLLPPRRRRYFLLAAAAGIPLYFCLAFEPYGGTAGTTPGIQTAVLRDRLGQNAVIALRGIMNFGEENYLVLLLKLITPLSIELEGSVTRSVLSAAWYGLICLLCIRGIRTDSEQSPWLRGVWLACAAASLPWILREPQAAYPALAAAYLTLVFASASSSINPGRVVNFFNHPLVFLICLALLVPLAVSAMSVIPVSQSNIELPNRAAALALGEIHPPGEIRLLESSGHLCAYVPAACTPIGTALKKSDQPVSVFLDQNRVTALLVNQPLAADKNFGGDAQWKQFIRDSDRFGFTRRAIPGLDAYFLLKSGQ